MKTYIFHLQAKNYEQAWETHDKVLSTPDAPLELKDTEVGTGESGELVFGFSIDTNNEDDVNLVAVWLMSHGFGIPKIYQMNY